VPHPLAAEAKRSDVRIDRRTGEFVVGEQKLSPGLVEEDFLISELGSFAKRIRRAGSQHYYETWRHVSTEMEMGLTLAFLSTGHCSASALSL